MEKITRQVIMKVFSALHIGAGSFRGGGGGQRGQFAPGPPNLQNKRFLK